MTRVSIRASIDARAFGSPSIQKFIVSATTSFGLFTWSSTDSCKAGWMLPSSTKGESAYCAGIFGSNVANTFSCVSSVSREVRFSLYFPAQRKVLPVARSTPFVSTPRPSSRSVVAEGKSSPTTATSRQGAYSEAAYAP